MTSTSSVLIEQPGLMPSSKLFKYRKMYAVKIYKYRKMDTT